MKNKIKLLIVLLSFLMIQTVSAIDTEIKIKTMPYHEVQLTTYDPSATGFEAFEYFKNESDKYGDVKFTFSSNEPEFNIIIYIKWNGETVIQKKYEESYEAGTPVYIEIAPAGYKFIETPEETETENEEAETNSTPENTTTPEETAETNTETSENDNALTGQAITENEEDSPISPIIWIILAVVVIAVALLFAMKKGLFKHLPTNPYETKEYKFTHTKKEANAKEALSVNPHAMEKQLVHAEKRLREAQMEINRLKNNKRIEEAEKKLEEDRNKLQRLKAGYEE